MAFHIQSSAPCPAAAAAAAVKPLHSASQGLYLKVWPIRAHVLANSRHHPACMLLGGSRVGGFRRLVGGLAALGGHSDGIAISTDVYSLGIGNTCDRETWEGTYD